MTIPLLPPTIDRRTAQRRVLRQAATLTQGKIERQATTWDVAANGLCLLSAKPIAPGSRWQVRFELQWGDQTRTVTVDVKVVYSSYTGSESFKIGAMLIDPTGDGANTLREFIAAT